MKHKKNWFKKHELQVLGYCKKLIKQTHLIITSFVCSFVGQPSLSIHFLCLLPKERRFHDTKSVWLLKTLFVQRGFFFQCRVTHAQNSIRMHGFKIKFGLFLLSIWFSIRKNICTFISHLHKLDNKTKKKWFWMVRQKN